MDTPKLSATMAGSAIKFAFKPPAEPAPTGNPVTDATAKRASRGVAVVTDHPVSTVGQTLFGVAAIAFAVQPINLAFDPLHVVPLAMPAVGRWALAGFGCLFLPFVPATFAASVATVAPAVKAVLDLVRGFLPGKKE